MKFSIFLLTLVALLPGSLFAQSGDVQTARFCALSWTRLIDDVYIRDARGEKVPLWIPNGSPSKEYEVQATQPLTFLRQDGVDAEGMPIEKVVATYTGSLSQEQLLIFVENGRGGAYNILPFDFASSASDLNQYRFINLSSFPVFVKFGDDQFKVSTRGEKQVRVPLENDGGMSIAMAIQVSEQPGDAKIAYSSVWKIRNGRSALVFLTTDLNQDERIDVKKIYF